MTPGVRAAADAAARPAASARANWLWGVLLALAGSVLFSGKAIIVKLAYRHGVDALSLIALRMAFALPFFAAAAWWSERGRAPQRGTSAAGATSAAAPTTEVTAAEATTAMAVAAPATARTERPTAPPATTTPETAAAPAGPTTPAAPSASKGPRSSAERATATQPAWQPGDAWRVVGIGLCGYYLASFLDFLGLQYVSAGLERVILYLNPTLVLLISFVWLGRRASPREWAALVVAYAGVLIVFMHDLEATGRNVPLGAALVFASACAYAVYLVAGGALVQRLGSIRLTAWASIVACAACIVQALLIDPAALFAQAPAVYALSVANALLCTVLPVFLVMMAIERIGSGPASQIGMVGPVATIGMAAVWLGEPVTGTQLAGTAIVLASVFLLSARRA